MAEREIYSIKTRSSCEPAGKFRHPIVSASRFISLFLGMTAFHVNSTAHANVTSKVEYPGKEWRECSPQDAIEKSSRPLTQFLQKTSSSAAMIIEGGCIFFQYGDVKKTSRVHSIRKSILSALYGKYVESGTVKLNSSLKELGIGDLVPLKLSEQQATIEDLLTAKSGIYLQTANGGDDSDFAPPRGSKKHGEHFLYNNWDFNAAGTIFEKVTGKSIYVTLKSDIGDEIEFQDFRLSENQKSGDKNRSQHLAYHIRLSARDMARFGYLMLNNGRWQEKQIVPSAWVKKSTTQVTSVEQMQVPKRKRQGLGYSYLWWVLERPPSKHIDLLKGSFLAKGLHGQYLLVSPGLNLVFVNKVNSDTKGLKSMSVKRFFEFVDLFIELRKKKKNVRSNSFIQ